MTETTLVQLESLLAKDAPGLLVKRCVPMATLTTLRLGGPADALVEPSNQAEVRAALRAAKLLEVPVTIIGQGSNLLVRDGGIRGLVIRMNRNMADIRVQGNEVTALAGTMLGTVSRVAAENNLAGLVFASGIPGTVGGGVIMNAGAYGGEMSQVVIRVEGLRMDGTSFRYEAGEMGFGYRTSRLQQEDVIVTQVVFHLPQGDRETLLQEMAELNARRREKQPLDVPSAGSTFKRPTQGYASALIDQCGLKGLTVGGAQVSEKHAGFCVNRGGTAADFLCLMAKVQQAVYEQTGVHLESEVRMVGEDAPAVRV